MGQRSGLIRHIPPQETQANLITTRKALLKPRTGVIMSLTTTRNGAIHLLKNRMYLTMRGTLIQTNRKLILSGTSRAGIRLPHEVLFNGADGYTVAAYWTNGSMLTRWRSSRERWPTNRPSSVVRHSAHRPSADPGCQAVHHHQAVQRPANQRRRDGQPLAVATVTHLHAVFRKAFHDALIVDELIGANTVERAKRPRVQAQEPGTVWTIAQLRVFLAHRVAAPAVRLVPCRGLPGARRGELPNLRWKDIDLGGVKAA